MLLSTLHSRLPTSLSLSPPSPPLSLPHPCLKVKIATISIRKAKCRFSVSLYDCWSQTSMKEDNRLPLGLVFLSLKSRFVYRNPIGYIRTEHSLPTQSRLVTISVILFFFFSPPSQPDIVTLPSPLTVSTARHHSALTLSLEPVSVYEPQPSFSLIPTLFSQLVHSCKMGRKMFVMVKWEFGISRSCARNEHT